jgi:hypothetical protein
MMYSELDFDTLPLIAGSKKPYVRAWQSCLSYRLWQSVPQDANIGIRGGGLANVAFIDCDEKEHPGTFETVTAWLAGLGYRGDNYPVVQTASCKGRHVYVTFSGGLSGDWRVLSHEIGAGEFRFGPGSYVVAPPSIIKDGGAYTLLSGDFSTLPRLALDDILPIIQNKEIVTECKPTISRRASAMLRGEHNKMFQSRSHFDESLIATLINSGHAFENVLELFENNPTSGKYQEIKKAKGNKAALHYLSKSYSEARQWTQAHESKARQIAQSAIIWAESNPWPGRTGAVDQLVYLAHARIAYKAGRLTYAAACRDLAELAGIGKTTATRSTWRLNNLGLIISDRKAVADLANVYQLGQLDVMGHSPSTPNVRKCPTMLNHDVFRHRGLGKSAGEVYVVLREHSATADELAGITGRHIETIKRVLDRMAKLSDPLTGEYLPMVASDDPQGKSGGKTYHSLPVDLDRIAHLIGTAGMGERQRKEHVRERQLHAFSLLKGRESIANHLSTSGDSKEV